MAAKIATPPDDVPLFDVPDGAAVPAPAVEHPAMTKWSADLVRVLGGAWRSIQRRHPDVPDVVITVAAGAGKRALTLGHFAAGSWRRGDLRVHELMIGAEGLAHGSREVLRTLLHEAAHGLAATREVKDTSRQGRYHSTVFKLLAIEIGLAYPTDGVKPEGYGTLGWSGASLPDDTAALYTRELARLDAALTAFRAHPGTSTPGGGGEGSDGDKGDEDGGEDDVPRKTFGPVVCGCPTPRRIQRIAYAVLELGPIVCGLCGQDFHDPDAPALDDEDQDDETDE